MPRWLKGVLTRIHGLADARKVRFTHKALREHCVIVSFHEEDTEDGNQGSA